VDSSQERSGTLILRVWVEDDRDERLRVRVIRVSGQHQAPPLTATTVDGACDAVRAWLDELLDTDT
jgi:hypothetical protein